MTKAKLIFVSNDLQHHAALIERKERQDDGARVLGFYAPTKMFYELWVNRGDRAINETDRISELRTSDLVVNARIPEKLAALDEALREKGFERHRMNQYHQWSIIPLKKESRDA